MTGTVLPWQSAASTTKLTNLRNESRSLNLATDTASVFLQERPNLRLRSVASSTSVDDEPISAEPKPIPVDRIYPHVFDQEVQAGQALAHLRGAQEYVRSASEAFGEPDLEAVETSLAQVAVAMAAAYPLTVFNESLGGVVAFVRRATLAASVDNLSRSSLNALAVALRVVTENPMLDLDDAADVVEKLETEGWQGGHRLANEILASLFDESDMDAQQVQELLFPDAREATR